MEGLAVFYTFLILFEISSVSSADLMPRHMLMEQIRGGLLDGGRPGGGFFSGAGPGQSAGMGGSGPGSAMRQNRGHRPPGSGIFGGSFPLAGGAFGDSIPGPRGGLFGGPIGGRAFSGPTIDNNEDLTHQPGSALSRSKPSVKPSGDSRFGEEYGESSEEAMFHLPRKRRGQRPLRDHIERQRYSRPGSQEVSAGLHGGKGREAGFAVTPTVTAHEGGAHGGGTSRARKRHDSGHSHGRGSSEEVDDKNEERDGHASHKGGSVSISTFAALSLARQCLNLLHDMLALLTTNRGA
ncbi:serine/threonine-protein phosphatase 1 regulatory subunit 10-like isoform X1 [Dermacentor albipictus]|uniref:serine/threonine-protein phosphatase 1 regulatory subunit 10-like isoform X1 n=1 Tax=Dermacentor albipictus TaxID=60249 RepID=UPI0038FC0558